MEKLLVSVIVVTRNRPEMVQQCLEHLSQQTYSPFETIVVDGSSNRQTEQALQQFPDVRYIYLPDGKDRMTQARNLGIDAACGEVVAFIDDDSMVRAGWLCNLVSPYTTQAVGGVGGRVIDEMELRHQTALPVVGKVFPNGQTIDNFVRDIPNIIEVDRFKGCNMSFRRDALIRVGMFDNFYQTTWDDVDICIRLKQAGYQLLYNSRAVVDHLTVAQEGGRLRSTADLRVMFSHYRNRTYFVLTNYGWLGQHIIDLFVLDTTHHFYLWVRHPSAQKFGELIHNLRGKIVGSLFAAKNIIFKRRT